MLKPPSLPPPRRKPNRALLKEVGKVVLAAAKVGRHKASLVLSEREVRIRSNNFYSKACNKEWVAAVAEQEVVAVALGAASVEPVLAVDAAVGNRS